MAAPATEAAFRTERSAPRSRSPASSPRLAPDPPEPPEPPELFLPRPSSGTGGSTTTFVASGYSGTVSLGSGA